MAESLRVLFVGDASADAERAVAHLTRSGLALEVRRVAAARDVERALEEFRPEAIVSDHGVPGLSLLETLRALRRAGPPIPFIVLTAALDPEAVVDYVRAGADAVVLKADLERLPPALKRALELRAGLKALSPRQVEVLRLVAAGLKTPQIAGRLGISAKTADTHRTALMSRLDIHEVTGLVRYAMRVGLVALDEP